MPLVLAAAPARYAILPLLLRHTVFPVAEKARVSVVHPQRAERAQAAIAIVSAKKTLLCCAA